MATKRRRRTKGAGSIRETPSGTFKLTLEIGLPGPVTGKRTRLNRTFPTRDEAEQAGRKLSGKRRRGQMEGAPERIKVHDWLTSWLDRHHAEGHITSRTQERYDSVIRLHLSPALGGYRLHDLRPDHINMAKAAWLSGQESTAARPLGAATVKKQIGVLSRALDDAVEAGLLDVNPCARVRLPSIGHMDERRALDETEIAALLRAAGDGRYSVPVRLTLATGLRLGELLGLRWSDLDLDGGVLHVRQAASYVSGQIDFHPPKTARSRRSLQLSPATVRMLRQHKAAQAARRLQAGPDGWIEHGLAFPSTIGTPWLPRTHSRDWRTVLDRSEMSDPGSVKWHTLRHTAGSQWIRAGASLVEVSRRLGHSSTDFTARVYVHVFPDQQETSARALDRLIG